MKINKYILFALVLVLIASTNASALFEFKKEYLLSLIEKFRLSKFEEKTNFSDRMAGKKGIGGVTVLIRWCEYDYCRLLDDWLPKYDLKFNLMRLENEMLKNFD